MKILTLKLDDAEYQKVRYLSDKLGLSMMYMIRSLIPNIDVPQEKTIDEKDAYSANVMDLVKISNDFDKEELRKILKDLISKGWASTLAKEIRIQILDNSQNHITVNTYKRLSRWLHPYRWTDREKYVKPQAEKISVFLFGRIIERINT